VGTSEEKGAAGISGHRWVDNIKIDLGEIA
jgi:hypothetical protein